MDKQRIFHFEFAIVIAMLISLLTDLFQMPDQLSLDSQILYGTLFIALSGLKVYYEGSRIILVTQTIAHGMLMLSKFINHSSYILLILVLAFMGLSFGLMVAMPVFLLPEVTGLWAVGFTEFTLDTKDKVSVYYPVDRSQRLVVKDKYVHHVRQRAYADELLDHFKNALPVRVPYFVVRLIMGQLYKTCFEVLKGAPITTELKEVPVVIFSNGLGGLRDHYSYILRELASQGYLVFALQSDEDINVLTSDEVKTVISGVATSTNEIGIKLGEKVQRLRNVQLGERVKNTRLLLDKIHEKGFCGKLLKFADFKLKNEIIGAGHSFGGCTVLQVAIEDKRMNGGVILYDPYFLPLEQRSLEFNLNIPVLCINSETFKTRSYNQTVERSLRLFKAQSWQLCVEMKHSDHLSFTDIAFLIPGEMRVFTELNTYKHITKIARGTLELTNLFLRHKSSRPVKVVTSYEPITGRADYVVLYA